MILNGMSMFRSIIYLCAKVILPAKIHTSDNKGLAGVKKSPHNGKHQSKPQKIKQKGQFSNKLIFSVAQSNMNSSPEVQQTRMENVPA